MSLQITKAFSCYDKKTQCNIQIRVDFPKVEQSWGKSERKIFEAGTAFSPFLNALVRSFLFLIFMC